MQLTAELLEPLVTAITGNMNVILPVGITIMGIGISIRFVVKTIRSFL